MLGQYRGYGDMARNKAEVYLHFVWATLDKHPLITPAIERRLYRYIISICERRQCLVLAIGGTENHVHLAVTLPTTLTIADLMQEVKGGSSYFVRETLTPGEFFAWRHGYGVFSFSRSQFKRVTSYIRNQKEHHRQETLWPAVEALDFDETASVDDSPDRPQAT